MTANEFIKVVDASGGKLIEDGESVQGIRVNQATMTLLAREYACKEVRVLITVLFPLGLPISIDHQVSDAEYWLFVRRTPNETFFRYFSFPVVLEKESAFEQWFTQQYRKLPNPIREEKAKRAMEIAVNRISKLGKIVEEERHLKEAMKHALYGWQAKEKEKV